MAQKMVDERHGTMRSTNWWRKTKTSGDFSNFYISSSAFKGKDEGCINSFKAVRYYSEEAGKRREEILKEIAEEEKASAEA